MVYTDVILISIYFKMPVSFTQAENLQSFINFCALISSDTPRLITRAAGLESVMIECVLRKRCGEQSSLITRALVDTLESVANNAGILIKNQSSLDNFVDSNMRSYLNSDAILVWDGNTGDQFRYCLDYLRSAKSNLRLITAFSIEPYYSFHYPSYADINPYKNKNILIISSHIDSMKSQAESGNYSKCFSPHNIFHQCNFKFIRPPQTHAGNHGNKDWQSNLPGFVENIKSVGDFDLALVSCGGYGTPVVDYIHKKFNKTVVYVGGPLQLFFGIIGSRWRENEVIMKYYNKNKQHWISPLASDTPTNAHSIEDGCYW